MSTKDSLAPEEIDFLQHSNWIENERSDEALEDAIDAWVWARDEMDSINGLSILVIHQRLMRRLNPRIAGRFRNVRVTVGGRATPSPDEAYQKLLMWEEDNQILPIMPDTEDFIKQSHIDFEHIHPFEDGNGRVGRIIMNWQRVKQGLPIHVILEEKKHEYYKWFQV